MLAHRAFGHEVQRELHREVPEARAAGLSYATIGGWANISAERARQIFEEAARDAAIEVAKKTREAWQIEINAPRSAASAENLDPTTHA